MRVTDTGRRKALVRRVRANQSQLQEAIEDISSGKKIRKPSDDPVASAMIDRLRSASEQHRNFVEVGKRMRDKFEVADDALGGATNALQRVQELAVQFADEPIPGQQEANSAAEQIGRIKETLREKANAKHNGKFLFAGTRDTSKAFEDTGPGYAVYQGGDTRSVQISYQTEVSQVDGDKVFGDASGKNTFEVLSDIQDALSGPTPDADAVRAELDNLKNSMDRVSRARQKLGYQMETIDHARNFSESIVLQNTEDKQNLEATDIAKASTRIQSATNALEATTQVAQQIQQASQSFLKL